MTDILSMKEQQELEYHEAIVERGLQASEEARQSLRTIQEKRLYRAQYRNWAQYCYHRWGFSPQFAHNLISAEKVEENLSTMVDEIFIRLPNNERQARPLTQLPPDQQREAWQEAVRTAPDGKVTGAHVERVVFDYKRDSRTSRPQNLYEPQGYDACQTPAYALDPILPYLNEDWIIWEPAAGENYLVEALYDSGFKEDQIITSDILTGQNFFEFAPDDWDCLITNPPYSIKYEWLKRCYELGKPFALLVPVEILGTKTAQLLFEEYGLEIMLLDQRINFKMPNKGWDSSAQFPTFWLCWQLLPQQIVFGKVKKHVYQSSTV